MDTEEGLCYWCDRHVETVRHECIYGTANRINSKHWGTWVNICPYCHAEAHQDSTVSIHLKQDAQREFESRYGHEKFMEVFGRNYL